MASPELPLAPSDGAGGERQRRLQDCLERLEEAEGLLSGVRRAEEAVLSARKTLKELCSEVAAPPVQQAQAEPPAEPKPARDVQLGSDYLVDEIVLSTMCAEAERPEKAEAPVEGTTRLSRMRSFISHHTPQEQQGQQQKHKSLHPGGWHSADIRRGFVLAQCCCGLYVPIFFPDCKFTIFWDLLGLALIIFETFALPVYLSFAIEPTGFFFWFVSFVNVYFIVDIPLNFTRGFKANNEIVVLLPRFIARRYLKWIALDITAGIPWEWLETLVHHSTWAQLTKMLRLLRVARLVRLLRLDVLPERAKICIEANVWLSFFQGVVRVLFILFSITHWAACIWFFVGSNTSNETTWITAHLPGGKDADFTTEYMYSLYFTLTTMTTVGYGDITPQNDDEVFFTLILLLVATVVFATLMGALTDLICSLQAEQHTQDARVRMLSHYMSWRALPKDLVRAVRKHMLYLWQTNRGYDAYEDEVKEGLPPVLRKELCYHVHGQTLRSISFLSWLWDYESCLKELASVIHSHIFSRGDQIFYCGQPNTSMFILRSGFARISLNESLFDFKLVETMSDEEEEPQREDSETQRILAVLGQIRPPSPKDGGEAGAKEDSGQVLVEATEKMQRQDMQKQRAARYIQRLWQRRKSRRKSATKVKKVHHIRSRTVQAPAYFGEACLWVEFEKWNAEELRHKYSARCESISEVLVIPRREIQELIWRFSPWLKVRFEQFQSHVLEGLQRRLVQEGERSSKAGAVPDDAALSGLQQPQLSHSITERSMEEVCTAAGEQLAALALRSRAAASNLLGTAGRSPGQAWRTGGAMQRMPFQPGGQAAWATLREPLMRSNGYGV